jgi:sortase A
MRSLHPLRWIERLLLTAGVSLLLVYAAIRVDGWAASRAAIQQLDAVSGAVNSPPAGETGADAEGVDFSLWSEKRVREFKESLSLKREPPLGVLALDRLRIHVPVFEGTDDVTLNRGVGWIEGTAPPGRDGNVGIAGHRDGFFRPLKDVAPGDRIELRTRAGVRTYRVSDTEIVNPEDVYVLQPRAMPSLTLVTCYPFYYIGSAPQRFIVHATLEGDGSRDH